MQHQTLSSSLESKKKELASVVSEGLMEKFSENVLTLEKRFKPSPPPVGTIVSSFSLPNQLGKDVSIAELLKENNFVILVWYRGSWCPYCNVTLKVWRDRLHQLKEIGAAFVALSAETPDESLDFRQKSDLNFEVLTDDGCVIGEKYGLAYEISDDMLDTHSQIGVKFHEINGNTGKHRMLKLVVPAAIVIGKEGKVVFSEAFMDYTQRTEPDKVIAQLKAM